MPKFLDIQQSIRDAIREGTLKPNQQTPSENQLASTFSVSRMTARRALQELVAKNVLFSVKGRGTFVSDPRGQSPIFEFKNIADEIRERGSHYKSRVLLLTSRPADRETAFALGTAEGNEVFFSMIVHLQDGIAVQLEQRAVNPDFAPQYLAQDFNHTTPHDYLCGVAPLTEASHQIEAILPTSSMCEWLKIDAAQPCIQVTRQTLSDKSAVSFARLIYPGHRYRLGNELVSG
ncbi:MULTISPECIES: histidine utilization repressor [Corallincola]|uniref:Histidine utilization repressor n=3 Tax=Corallincola TaxID=1775176 RepID=A0A368NTA6_9GAMM|nr:MULTISPECIES: histidine utilization repressor [Corallincola]RCU52719.1 histidine utilization repressor [Corallincola holothuriorum]TAA48100.1 histidine utilization repressor [Corallincola spongiicola]TCI03218.1 histidine utilization repressor [Corallincola luteus]